MVLELELASTFDRRPLALGDTTKTRRRVISQHQRVIRHSYFMSKPFFYTSELFSASGSGFFETRCPAYVDGVSGCCCSEQTVLDT